MKASTFSNLAHPAPPGLDQDRPTSQSLGREEHAKHLTAIIEREGQGYVSLCPELDIASQGDSIEEARVNLQEALELFFETASPE